MIKALLIVLLTGSAGSQYELFLTHDNFDNEAECYRFLAESLDENFNMIKSQMAQRKIEVEFQEVRCVTAKQYAPIHREYIEKNKALEGQDS